MGMYEEYCLPHVTNCVCGLKPLMEKRRLVVPLAQGRVLEVGMGTALNLPYYDRQKVTHLWGLEPSQGMRRAARKNLQESEIKVQWLDLPAAQIPLEDAAADTVLFTFTLCSIADWRGALAEMSRVLKPEGRLIFCEHGAAPDDSVLRWQTLITPSWKHLAGGCHLDRPIPRLLVEGSFEILSMDSEYMGGVPKIAGFTYWGTARKAQKRCDWISDRS